MNEKEENAKYVLYRMRPHFLFNVLGAIGYTIKVNPDLAYERILDLSDYLRGIFQSFSDEEMISLKEEVQHVISYINLERLRFGEHFELCFDMEEDDFMLPPLTLQMLVENAVKHGFERGSEEGVIKIRSAKTLFGNVIQVEDNGVGFDVDAYNKKRNVGIKGKGIEKVKWRIENLLKGSVLIESNVGTGTVVTIVIPKK